MKRTTRPSRRFVGLAIIAGTLALAYGIWYAYSVLLVALLREFGWSRSVLAGAFSVFTLVHGAAGPLAGALCARIAPRALAAGGGVALGASLLALSAVTAPWHLYLAFGVLTALAVAACGWVPSLVQVQRDFPDAAGLAIGIASAGVGLGMLLVVPTVQAAIDAWGWRTALRILAAVATAWIVPTALLMLRAEPPRQRRAATRDDAALPGRAAPAGQTPAAAATNVPAPACGLAEPTVAASTVRQPPARPATYGMSLAQSMRTLPLWLMFGIYFLGNVAAQTLHVHQVAYFVDQGIATLAAASVVGVVGVSSIFGKIGSGWLSDRIDRELVYVGSIALVAIAVAVMAAVAWWPATWICYVYGALFGVGYSVTASLVPTMVSDRFGGRHFGAIVGFGLFGSAVGAALGAWSAGQLFDTTGSYALAFAASAASAIGAGALAWRARTLRRRSA